MIILQKLLLKILQNLLVCTYFILGLGTLPLQAPELAVEELKRCMNELCLNGIQIGSHVNEWNLDSLELIPVFAV